MNNLKPYAMSQIAEQVIRVIWMLMATFFIMKMGSETTYQRLPNRPLRLLWGWWLVLQS